MLLFVTAVMVVLVISFLCSIFESVLLSLTRPQIEVISRAGQSAGTLLARYKDNIDIPIAAILILNTAAHTVGASVAGASFVNVFDAGTLWIFAVLFTLAVLLFTEIIPKTLGVSYATVLAVPVAHGIHWLTVLLKPLVVLSETISRSLRREAHMPVTSAEEIRLLAALGRNEGVVGARMAGMIVGATQLRQLQAHDVMLPREDVHFLSVMMERDEVIDFVRNSGHSRFPLSPTRDLNDASGVVLAKELLYWLLTNSDLRIDWAAVQREALVVPESVALPRLLRTFQETNRQLAIVVDEYGTVEGIATLEDVLEEIVGDIQDESDIPVDEFLEQNDGTLVVRASVDLRKLSAKLDVPWEPESNVATVGGLVMESLERVPVAGDAISWHGNRIEVLRAGRRGASLLSVHKE